MNEEYNQIKSMMERGYLEEWVDTNGAKRYQITQKFREDHPEAAREWDTMIDEAVASLWQKGWLETIFEDNGDVSITLTQKVFTDSPEELSEVEYAILTSIIEWMLRNRGR